MVSYYADIMNWLHYISLPIKIPKPLAFQRKMFPALSSPYNFAEVIIGCHCGVSVDVHLFLSIFEPYG